MNMCNDSFRNSSSVPIRKFQALINLRDSKGERLLCCRGWWSGELHGSADHKLHPASLTSYFSSSIYTTPKVCY